MKHDPHTLLVKRSVRRYFAAHPCSVRWNYIQPVVQFKQFPEGDEERTQLILYAINACHLYCLPFLLLIAPDKDLLYKKRYFCFYRGNLSDLSTYYLRLKNVVEENGLHASLRGTTFFLITPKKGEER